MLDPQLLPFFVIGGILLLFCLVYIRAFASWIGGIWFEQKDPQSPIYVIHLRQFGPIVWGSAEVEGGTLRYRGWYNGKILTVRRRDFGRSYLSSMGFPGEVLKELDGSEMAKMRFAHDPMGGRLVGEHFPQKIEISRTRPPKILERGYLPPVPRVWYRNRRTLEAIARAEAELEANSQD